VATRRFGSGSAGGGAAVRFGDVLGSAPLKRVAELVDMGALVSLSRSRDGGAVAVTVTWDGEWERQWFRSEADAILQLDEWAGMVGDLSNGRESVPPAARQGARKRRS
jgi:hypothetical protein